MTVINEAKDDAGEIRCGICGGAPRAELYYDGDDPGTSDFSLGLEAHGR